jgi:DNA-directed RNA polymerase subunit H (RpoH/RPB5)
MTMLTVHRGYRLPDDDQWTRTFFERHATHTRVMYPESPNHRMEFRLLLSASQRVLHLVNQADPTKKMLVLFADDFGCFSPAAVGTGILGSVTVSNYLNSPSCGINTMRAACSICNGQYPGTHTLTIVSRQVPTSCARQTVRGLSSSHGIHIMLVSHNSIITNPLHHMDTPIHTMLPLGTNKVANVPMHELPCLPTNDAVSTFIGAQTGRIVEIRETDEKGKSGGTFVSYRYVTPPRLYNPPPDDTVNSTPPPPPPGPAACQTPQSTSKSG